MNQTMKVKQQQFSAYKAGNIWPTGHARYKGNFRFVYNTKLKYVKLGCGFCFDNETGFGSADDACPVCHGAGYLAKMYRYRYRPRKNRRIKKKISYPCPEGCGTEREVSYWGGCGCNGTGRLYVALK